MLNLDDMLSRIQGLDEKDRKAFEESVVAGTTDEVWIPNVGPQTDAYMSDADVMLYGGQAGGGKTHLELGWGVNKARSGIIFRREGTQTDGLEKEGKSIIGSRARFNGVEKEWTWDNGKTLKLAGMPQADDWIKHAGRERDYYGFDEAGEFLEMQVAQILAWLRAPPGLRTRVILGSNPPRKTDGLWLIKWFAPWLDDKFPDPAIPGELRHAVHVHKDDEITVHWVPGPGTHVIDGEEYISKSYTFIPASLHDNPYRDTPEYRSQLQSLPEPLRSQLLYGVFTAGLKDQPNQMIPTEWVRQAMDKWTERRPREDVPMCCIGVDCTGGGDDPMVQAIRYDGWYAPLVKTAGSQIPADRAGSMAAGLVLAERKDDAKVVVDMGGGYGGPLFEHLRTNGIDAVGYKGAEATARRAKGGIKFANSRSAAYWAFREALDPDQPGGSPIRLPKDNRLLAGLCAVTFEASLSGGIKAEPKVTYNAAGKVTGGVKAKLGFSPDEADAVVMAWWDGPKESSHAVEWLTRSAHKQPAVVTRGRTPLTARAGR